MSKDGFVVDTLRHLLEHGVNPNELICEDGDPQKAFVKRETIMSKEKDNDPVNHPSHYTSSPAACPNCSRPIECIDVVRHQNFNRGCAIKYVWRAGKKDNVVQDLKKAIWYIQDEINKLEAEQDPSDPE